MPKKSRKEKILADIHRKTNSITLKETQFVKHQIKPAYNTTPSTSESKFVYNKGIDVKPQNHLHESNLDYINNDLVKITIFSFFTLILLGVLYFLLNRN